MADEPSTWESSCMLLDSSHYDRPESMQSTSRSVMLELAVCIIGILTVIMHTFFHENIAVYYTVACLWIVIVPLAAYCLVDAYSFRLTMVSFRGLCIFVSLCGTVMTDVLLVSNCNEPWPVSTLLIDDVVYIWCVVIMMSSDTIPRITNFTRVAGPMLAMGAIAWYELIPGEKTKEPLVCIPGHKVEIFRVSTVKA